MYNLGVFSVIIMSGILKLTCGTDYCDPKLCTSNGVVVPHIGCKHSGKFASNCVQPVMIPVSPYLKKLILHEHNDLRNKLANGSLPGFKSAKRMLTLTWDSDLEFLACLNVRQCEMEHDQCHNTIAYKYSGQNIGVQHQTDPLYPPEYESLILYIINAWFNEYKFATQRDTDKVLRIDYANEIGHFTEFVQERTSKVGCGISRYVKFLYGENWDTLLFACNYNYGNMVGLPTYIPGRMASACKTGSNPEFNGLCSLNENVPPIPESEEEVPLHPVFTKKNRLMQTVTSDEPVCAAPSRQATQIKVGRSSGPPNIELLLQRAVARDNQRAITRSINRPQQTGLRPGPSIIVSPPEQDRIAARTCNIRPVPAPRGISPGPSARSIRPIPAPSGISPVPIRRSIRAVTLPRSVNVPPPVPLPSNQPKKYVPVRPTPPAQLDNESEEDLPPPLPLKPPPTMKQSAPLMEPVKACPIKLTGKHPPVKQYPAINRQVRPVPSNFPVRPVPPVQLDDESDEDLPPPLPLQPPPTMKRSASITVPNKDCPIRNSKSWS